MLRAILLGAAIAALTVCESQCVRAADPSEPYARILSDHGIAADVATLKTYLRTVATLDGRARRLRTLVKRLGDSDFARRERATWELARLPSSPRNKLIERATHHADPQVVWRAEWVLARRKRDGVRPDQVLHAALRIIAREKRARGFTALLLDVAPQCTVKHLRDALYDALKSQSAKDDLSALRKALGQGHAARRVAAIVALSDLVGESSETDLRALYADKDHEVRLAAALQRVKRGDRSALPVLGRLLESDQVEIRAKSVHLLRGLSGKRFGFDANQPADARKIAAAAWREWVRQHGGTAELTPVGRGLRYVACVQKGAIVGLGADGAVLWRIDDVKGYQFKKIRSPSGCVLLPNDNWLISSRTMPYLFEVDREGKLVRKIPVRSPSAAVQPLANGRLLVTSGSMRKLYEITWTGEVKWQASVKGLATDALRLPNGNTLVPLHNFGRLVEVNPKGETSRVFDRSLATPLKLRRLDNGNLLAADSKGKLAEYTSDGTPVWSYKPAVRPYDVTLLNSGNLLVGDEQGVREMTRKGQTRWQTKLGRVERVYRVP